MLRKEQSSLGARRATQTHRGLCAATSATHGSISIGCSICVATLIKRTLPPLSTHHPPLTPLSRPSLPTAQGLAQAEKPKPAWSGPSQPKSLHGRGDGEATSIWSSCARQRAASLRPLARLAQAAGPASWTVRTTAAPPRAAGQPSLKELRCENSESEDERVGVDSSGGPDRAGCATHDAQSSPRASGMGRASSHLVLCWCASLRRSQPTPDAHLMRARCCSHARSHARRLQTARRHRHLSLKRPHPAPEHATWSILRLHGGL